MTNFFRKLKNELIECFCKNKFFLILFVCFFVFGVIVAIVNLINLKNIIILKNLTDNCLLDFLKGDLSLFGFFLRRFFGNILIFLIIFLLCFNKYSSFLVCFWALFCGYFIVFDMGVLIVCFGFFGLIFAFFNTFLLEICYVFLMLLLCFYCKNCCGKYYFSEVFSNYQFLCLMIIFLLLLCFVDMILLSVLSSTFVIVF